MFAVRLGVNPFHFSGEIGTQSTERPFLVPVGDVILKSHVKIIFSKKREKFARKGNSAAVNFQAPKFFCGGTLLFQTGRISSRAQGGDVGFRSIWKAERGEYLVKNRGKGWPESRRGEKFVGGVVWRKNFRKGRGPTATGGAFFPGKFFEVTPAEKKKRVCLPREEQRTRECLGGQDQKN